MARPAVHGVLCAIGGGRGSGETVRPFFGSVDATDPDGWYRLIDTNLNEEADKRLPQLLQRLDLPHRNPQLLDIEATAGCGKLHFEFRALAQPSVFCGDLDEAGERALRQSGDLIQDVEWRQATPPLDVRNRLDCAIDPLCQNGLGKVGGPAGSFDPGPND